MTLHLDQEIFKLAIEQTAKEIGIQEIYVEKTIG